MTASNQNNSCVFFRIQWHMKDLLRRILLLNEYIFEELYDDLRPFCRIKSIHFRVSNHFLTFCGFVLLSGMVIAFLRVLKFFNVQYFAMPSDIHINNVVGMP